MKYVIELDSGGLTYVPMIIKIGTGIKALLRVWLNNLNGCNVGITKESALRSILLKWAQVA
jgi:hypothetical protein